MLKEKEKSDRDCFIESNLRLVHSLCKRFSGRGIEYDDLYQAGCMGLIKATDAFDKERGLCFSTYAVPVIMGEIRRLFRDGGAVKVSRSVKELGMKISRERQKLEQKLCREPTVKELALSLGVSPEELTERFVRGDSSRSTEGSGLGLSIAKSLMELQGGTLTLKIDGDLFKAIVELPLIGEKPDSNQPEE